MLLLPLSVSLRTDRAALLRPPNPQADGMDGREAEGRMRVRALPGAERIVSRSAVAKTEVPMKGRNAPGSIPDPSGRGSGLRARDWLSVAARA